MQNSLCLINNNTIWIWIEFHFPHTLEDKIIKLNSTIIKLLKSQILSILNFEPHFTLQWRAVQLICCLFIFGVHFLMFFWFLQTHLISLPSSHFSSLEIFEYLKRLFNRASEGPSSNGKSHLERVLRWPEYAYFDMRVSSFALLSRPSDRRESVQDEECHTEPHQNALLLLWGKRQRGAAGASASWNWNASIEKRTSSWIDSCVHTIENPLKIKALARLICRWDKEAIEISTLET